MRFNFDDESVQDVGLLFPKLDLKKDEIARVCLITPYFDVTVRHWVDRVGYVHCHGVKSAKSFGDLVEIEKNPKVEECVMCAMCLRNETKDMVGLPMRHAATYALRYHTDTRGQLLHGQLGYHLEVWLLSNKKYKEVISLQKEWGGLQHYDIELVCTDTKFKNFDISLKKEAYWKTKADSDLQREIMTYLKEEIERYPLSVCLGDEIPKDMLMRRFEVIRRKSYPDDNVDLGASSVTDNLGDDIIPGSKAPFEDPFKLIEDTKEGAIPSAVTPEEREEAQKPESPNPLDSLIP